MVTLINLIIILNLFLTYSSLIILNMHVCYGGDVTALRYWNEILAVYVTQFTGAIGDK